MMAGFDLHSVCARCRDKKKGKDPCVEKPGPVFTKILRIFLRITLKSKKNSMLTIFLFLE